MTKFARGTIGYAMKIEKRWYWASRIFSIIFIITLATPWIIKLMTYEWHLYLKYMNWVIGK